MESFKKTASKKGWIKSEKLVILEKDEWVKLNVGPWTATKFFDETKSQQRKIIKKWRLMTKVSMQ